MIFILSLLTQHLSSNLSQLWHSQITKNQSEVQGSRNIVTNGSMVNSTGKTIYLELTLLMNLVYASRGSSTKMAAMENY